MENHDAVPVCDWDPYCSLEPSPSTPLYRDDVAFDEMGKLKAEQKKLVDENVKLRTMLDKALHDRLCAQCLFNSLQKKHNTEDTSPNSDIQKALGESWRRYLEKGYREMERLTHESYSLSSLAFSWSLIFSYVQCNHSPESLQPLSSLITRYTSGCIAHPRNETPMVKSWNSPILRSENHRI